MYDIHKTFPAASNLIRFLSQVFLTQLEYGTHRLSLIRPFLYFCCCLPSCLPDGYIMVTGPNWPYTCRFARQAKSFIWACIDVSHVSPLPVPPVFPVSHLPVSALYQCSAHQQQQQTVAPKVFLRQDQCRENIQDKINAKYSKDKINSKYSKDKINAEKWCKIFWPITTDRWRVTLLKAIHWLYAGEGGSRSS